MLGAGGQGSNRGVRERSGGDFGGGVFARCLPRQCLRQVSPKAMKQTTGTMLRLCGGSNNCVCSLPLTKCERGPKTKKRKKKKSKWSREFIRLLFLQAHRETDRFFAASGVQSAQSNLGSSYFHFRRAAFSGLLKSKCVNIIAKASVFRVNLNLDGTPISSNSHTHPSHSQTSRLLTSSLSLGVPVPRPTQCMGGA